LHLNTSTDRIEEILLKAPALASGEHYPMPKKFGELVLGRFTGKTFVAGKAVREGHLSATSIS
jgi:hypothetical protein